MIPSPVCDYLPDLQDLLLDWQNDYSFGKITAPALVAQTLVLMSRVIYRNRAFKIKLSTVTEKNEFMDPCQVVQNGLLTGVPEAAYQAFDLWSRGKIKLRLLFHIPTPLEVLQIQCQGERCLSLLIDEAHLLKTDERDRDFFSFLIHDLVHAHHFWKTQDEYHGQIQFYEKMKSLVEQNHLIQKALTEPRFKSEFEYLISDMNSHPRHLEWTLIAQIRNWQKRQLNTARLNADQDHEFDTWVKETLQPSYSY